MKDTLRRPEIHILYSNCLAITPGVEWRGQNLSSPYWRLYWNDRRGAELVLEGGVKPMEPKHLYLIPPNTPYQGKLARPVQHVFIHFLFDLDYQGPANTILPLPVTNESLALLRILRQPVAADAEESPKRWLAAQALVYSSLTQLPDSLLGLRYNDERIVAAVEWMHTHSGERMSNVELARRAHLSTNGFIRLFRQVVGVSPQDYHLRVRVDHSCVLLHHSRQSVDQIAEATGFCDRYHFTRAFRRFRGLGPATFRKLLP